MSQVSIIINRQDGFSLNGVVRQEAIVEAVSGSTNHLARLNQRHIS